MNKPITILENRLVAECAEAGINTSINDRWENGVPHHPRAEIWARRIAAADWLFADGCFDLKFGGDGDNGEFLLYILDILCDLDDAKARQIVETEWPKIEVAAP